MTLSSLSLPLFMARMPSFFILSCCAYFTSTSSSLLFTLFSFFSSCSLPMTRFSNFALEGISLYFSSPSSFSSSLSFSLLLSLSLSFSCASSLFLHSLCLLSLFAPVHPMHLGWIAVISNLRIEGISSYFSSPSSFSSSLLSLLHLLSSSSLCLFSLLLTCHHFAHFSSLLFFIFQQNYEQ